MVLNSDVLAQLIPKRKEPRLSWYLTHNQSGKEISSCLSQRHLCKRNEVGVGRNLNLTRRFQFRCFQLFLFIYNMAFRFSFIPPNPVYFLSFYLFFFHFEISFIFVSILNVMHFYLHFSPNFIFHFFSSFFTFHNLVGTSIHNCEYTFAICIFHVYFEI